MRCRRSGNAGRIRLRITPERGAPYAPTSFGFAIRWRDLHEEIMAEIVAWRWKPASLWVPKTCRNYKLAGLCPCHHAARRS